MAKHVFAALAVAVAAVVILTVLGITKGQSVYAQAPSSAFFVSAAPGNAASRILRMRRGRHC